MKQLKPILTAALALAAIAAATTALLAGTHALTRGRIEASQGQQDVAHMREIFPAAEAFEPETLPTEDGAVPYWVATRGGVVQGYVFTATNTGKAAGLTVMTGVGTDGRVAGLAVTRENETPGYVDRVKEDGLPGRLIGLADAREALAADATSGATKSSDGIRAGVADALRWYGLLRQTGAAG